MGRGRSWGTLNPIAGALTDMSVIGDSRVFSHNSTGYGGVIGTTCKSELSWAGCYYKKSFRVIANYGIGGARSDVFLTNGNFELAMTNGSGFLYIGPPVFNDINQAATGYIDTDGNAVTLANVVDLSLARLVSYIKRAISLGIQVCLRAEYGSSNFTAAQVACVHEFNRKARDALRTIRGAFFYNPNRLIWNATSSATLIAFKTNYSGDGTHLQQMAEQVVGKDMAKNLLPLWFPAVDSAVDNTSAVIANGVGQLFSNPLFTTLTGGSNPGTTVNVTSGTIPAGVTLSASTAGILSVAITSAANADGLGNDVTFTFTTTGSVVGRLDFGGGNNTNVLLTDALEMGLEYDIAAGNSANIYAELQLVGNSASINCFDMLGATQTPPMGPPSGLAETGLVLRTNKNTWPAGNASILYYLPRLNIFFPTGTPSGSTCAITLRRVFTNRYR